MTEPENTSFVRGNDHLDRLLSDPHLAAEVAQAHEAAEEMDQPSQGPIGLPTPRAGRLSLRRQSGPSA
ncbi:hypothetical protein Aph01nite_29390 [Acrocarpospora phusangensis]|uniref:Uncharacterized protein n=1 Tax=Acrocarpospora phusangensis TaxID=1070424 RepID=A0A919Q8U1_9ACTN|nr:hypothetical protein Aph01nite_29390 [Acrocarpospora phusangensis]